MGRASRTCVVCGGVLDFGLDAMPGPAEIVAPQCLECLEQQEPPGNDLILQLRRTPVGPLLALGLVTITRAAAAALAESGEHATELLSRHAARVATEPCACLVTDARLPWSKAFTVHRTSLGHFLWAITFDLAEGRFTILARAKEA